MGIVTTVWWKTYLDWVDYGSIFCDGGGGEGGLKIEIYLFFRLFVM